MPVVAGCLRNQSEKIETMNVKWLVYENLMTNILGFYVLALLKVPAGFGH